MSVNFCFEILSDCWENCKKISGCYFLRHPVHAPTVLILSFGAVHHEL